MYLTALYHRQLAYKVGISDTGEIPYSTPRHVYSPHIREMIDLGASDRLCVGVSVWPCSHD